MKLEYEHNPHPHIKEREVQRQKEPKTLNDKLAVAITAAVGTMWCAYAFGLLALIALPDALHKGLYDIIDWTSQSFIQLVMLSVIMVGQNIAGRASDRRADLTFKDAEATFHEARQIQEHLAEQDKAINSILDRLEAMESRHSKGQSS